MKQTFKLLNLLAVMAIVLLPVLGRTADAPATPETPPPPPIQDVIWLPKDPAGDADIAKITTSIPTPGSGSSVVNSEPSNYANYSSGATSAQILEGDFAFTCKIADPIINTKVGVVETIPSTYLILPDPSMGWDTETNIYWNESPKEPLYGLIAPTPVAGDVFALTRTGSTLDLYVNGEKVHTYLNESKAPMMLYFACFGSVQGATITNCIVNTKSNEIPVIPEEKPKEEPKEE